MAQRELRSILNTSTPIIQAPMFGVTTPAMVAAANKAGALGSLALADLSPDDCSKQIEATKSLTDKAFATNIFVHKIPEINDRIRRNFDKVKAQIEMLAAEHNLQVSVPVLDSLILKDYREQIDILVKQKCKIVSFTFGNLDADSIAKLKSSGTILIGTCTSVEEAIELENSGIDVVCTQGFEAGGHRGSFIDENIPTIKGEALLDLVLRTVPIPVIYAGGINSTAKIKQVLSKGAQAVQIGSMLLGSKETALADFEIERLQRSDKSEVTLTKAFSGRYARGLSNFFIREIEAQNLILPYPIQNKITAELRKQARRSKNPEFVNLWVGDEDYVFSRESTTDILNTLAKTL